jgi:copper chaperone CopZ
MPVLVVSLKKLLHCTGCMTSIENALYSSGAKHFEYDMALKVGKIVYDDKDANEIELVDAVKRIGYDLDVMEITQD